MQVIAGRPDEMQGATQLTQILYLFAYFILSAGVSNILIVWAYIYFFVSDVFINLLFIAQNPNIGIFFQLPGFAEEWKISGREF